VRVQALVRAWVACTKKEGKAHTRPPQD